MQNVLGGGDIVGLAVDRIKRFEPDDGYILAYSGGKDSDVVRRLVEIAQVKHSLVHQVTGLDAPETMVHISTIPNVIHDRPIITFWKLLVKEKIPPSRRMRWCCRYLKERSFPGRVVLTGIRRGESIRRAARSRIEGSCMGRGQTFFHPLFDWTEGDVWDFIREDKTPMNPLYSQGFSRVGCIGCPMATVEQRKQQFERWPQFNHAFQRGFAAMIRARLDNGMMTRWRTGQEVLKWYLAA